MDKPKKINKFGKIPINARITVDYSKEKPKISFGYIAKKQQQDLIYSNPFSLLLTMITLLMILALVHWYPNSDKSPLIGTCGIYEQHYLNSSKVLAYNISCGEKSYLLEYRKGTGLYPFGTRAGFYMDKTSNVYLSWLTDSKPLYLEIIINIAVLITAFGTIFLILFGVFGLTYVYGLILSKIPYVNKQVNKHTPELAKKMAWPRYIATFTECPQDKIIELPLFHNIFMDYEASKEFSKYLQRVEIREHPFSKLSRKSGFFKRRQKLKYKKKHNISLWKARFIFKEVPKTGKLEVRWA